MSWWRSCGSGGASRVGDGGREGGDGTREGGEEDMLDMVWSGGGVFYTLAV